MTQGTEDPAGRTGIYTTPKTRAPTAWAYLLRGITKTAPDALAEAQKVRTRLLRVKP